jgi:Tol biopolymer transport system component
MSPSLYNLGGHRIGRLLLAPVLAFAAFLFAAPVVSAGPFRYLTHEAGEVDYWPRWSPDGKTLLFSRCPISSGCGGGAPAGTWDLYTVPARGGQAALFLSIEGLAATRSNWLWTSDPSDTTPIAFTGVHLSGSAQSGIYIVGTDGSVTRLPTVDSIPNGYPTWFPEGSALCVEGQPNGFNGPLIDLVGVPDGSLLQTQTSPDQIWTGESAISRDGNLLAFAGQAPAAGSQYDDNRNQIWIQNLIPPDVDLEDFDTGLHQLDALQGRTPDWSPNDRFLIFESTRGCLNGKYAIFIEAAASGKATQVTDCRLNANHAVWAPDGRRFAFSAEFFSPQKSCAAGCRGIAVAPVPPRILRLGTQ